MKQKANTFSGGQEIPSNLWKLKVHHRVHKSLSLVPIMSHTNPVHKFPATLTPILILSSHLELEVLSVNELQQNQFDVTCRKLL